MKSKDIGALLDSCSWDDIGNSFCRLVSKTHCCRLNRLKCGLTLTQYLIMHVSIINHIRCFNSDLSASLKVKCDCLTGLPIYGFPLMFNSNGLTQLLYEI